MVPSRKKKPLQYVLALNKILRVGDYDAIHINGNSSTVAIDLMASIGTGVRSRIVHSHNTTGSHPISSALLRPAMTTLTTDRFACGNAAGKWMFRKLPFLVFPNGNDLDAYAFDPDSRERMRLRLSASVDDIVIGHVGTFNAQKNHEFLIKAFALAHAQNPRLRLALIGEGHLKESIKKLTADLGVANRVAFIGRSGEVPQYLSACDVGILPSLHEGLPNVVIEWQANGLPSYVSDTVTDECALTDLVSFLPIDDVTDWARSLAQLAASTDRSSASLHAREQLRFDGYDVADGAVRLRKIYAQIDNRISLKTPSMNGHDRSQR